MDSRISAIGVAHYDWEPLVAAVRRHFDALELWNDLLPGMKVVLKPNLLMRRSPELGTTTHPMVVEAVAHVLQEHGIYHIVVADSPGGPYTPKQLESIYSGTGMTGAAEHANIQLNVDTGWSEHTRPEAVLCRSFNLIDPITQADFVINLPKLKTHAMTTLSGGVKNLFGCVPGLQKPEFHFRFPEKSDFARMLLDLSLLVRPGITLVDAVVSMEGDGPSGGDLRTTGMTFAARNIYTLDLGLCHYLGLPIQAVDTVSAAIKDGLCPASPADLSWLGDGLPTLSEPFKQPASKSLSFSDHVPALFRRPVEWMERKWFSPRPVVMKKECIGCGKCVESCAPGAMTLENRKAVLELSKCIRCYCCHEMCPVKAIQIRRTKLLDL